MLTDRTTKRSSQTGRRAGYVVAVAVNAVLLYVVNNLLEWEWPSFLTDDFSRVVGLINLSLAATIAVNVAYLFHDSGWFKAAGQVIPAGISLAALVRLYRVFPFDFSAYEFNWPAATRVILIVAMVGTAIGIAVELMRVGTGRAAGPAG